MKTLAKYDACNHCVIGEKSFKNILIGPGKLRDFRVTAPGHRPYAKMADILIFFCPHSSLVQGKIFF